ncbi:MAG: hypothetical protein NC218_06705 [Acetobacter sp.]|nr:hypothetical protein [Acetobacter sp.]
MFRYATIVNNTTKQCDVGLDDDIEYYKSLGMEEMDVEQAYTGEWYIAGYAPSKPELTYKEKRLAEYPDIGEQLDMIFHDKENGTNLWFEKIKEIKEKYPKVNLND